MLVVPPQPCCLPHPLPALHPNPLIHYPLPPRQPLQLHPHPGHYLSVEHGGVTWRTQKGVVGGFGKNIAHTPECVTQYSKAREIRVSWCHCTFRGIWSCIKGQPLILFKVKHEDDNFHRFCSIRCITTMGIQYRMHNGTPLWKNG